MQYEFNLKFKLGVGGINHDEIMRRLADAGCTDALVGLGLPGYVGLEFIREADSTLDAILSALLPAYVRNAIYRALVENAASEQGARMTAMDNATRNAGDMINGLTIKYNRTRQAQITKELIEIISGAEAL